MTTFVTLIACGLLLLTGLYFLAPGVMFAWAMSWARRHAGLSVKTTEIDGHQVSYLEGGSGPPLLLLHGFAANKDHWTMVAPFLTKHFHVIAPDLPGFGDSSRLEAASYDLDSQLARIMMFADKVGFNEFDLGGNSMGGYFSTLLAERHPERVKSLWLLAPAGTMSAEPSETLQLMEAGDNPLVATNMAEFDRLSELCFHRAPPMPKQFKRPLLQRSMLEAPFNQKIFEQVFAEPVALEDSIDSLETQTLLVWGDNDRVLDKSGFDIMQRLLGNVSAVMMKDMGHVPMIERPAETAADYLRFRGVVS